VLRSGLSDLLRQAAGAQHFTARGWTPRMKIKLATRTSFDQEELLRRALQRHII
jgi:hypothetical protein